jgi:hypothetical protein
MQLVDPRRIGVAVSRRWRVVLLFATLVWLSTRLLAES